MRHSLIALDAFLGKTATDLNLSDGQLHEIIKPFDRMGLLAFYFQHGQDRDAIVKTFEPETEAEKISRLEQTLTDALSRIKELERPKEVLDIGSLAPKPQTPDYSDFVDLRPETLRQDTLCHVTHDAAAQWLTLFSGRLPSGDQTDVRRRIQAVYFQGALSGKGQIWFVKGIERYSMSGVKLTCVLVGSQMHVQKVEKIELADL